MPIFIFAGANKYSDAHMISAYIYLWHILIHGVKSLGAECIVLSVLSGVKVMSFKVSG